MTFRSKKIRSKPGIRWGRVCRGGLFLVGKGLKKCLPAKRKFPVAAILLSLVGIVIVFKVMMAAWGVVAAWTPQVFLSAAGSDLKADEKGYINLVLLGDGGAVRDGADLVDTIMVASIDPKKNAVSLFSIPRDYYVPANGHNGGRINELYRNNKNTLGEEAGYELFQKVTGQIAGLKIPYYLRVDFTAFVEAVDALGGVDVEVDKDISDPYYPNATDDGYTLFEIKAGPQHLDGETALKFVRSRKTTSDFDRAARQQKVLMALREKALSAELLMNPSRMKALYESLKRNINTNLTLRELLSLAALAKKFDKSHLVARVIHDDPGQEGGFLYTPEREQYDGKFVLIPFGENLDLIHRYTDLIFNKREAFYVRPRVEVLNGASIPGMARKVAYELNRFGFDVARVDNHVDEAGTRLNVPQSAIYYHEWETDKEGVVSPVKAVALQALETFLDAPPLPAPVLLQGSGVDFSVVLGEDASLIVH